MAVRKSDSDRGPVPVPESIGTLSPGTDGSGIKYLRQAVVIAPRYSQAYYEMGNCLARLGRYAEAMEKYQRAITINPAVPEPQEKMDRLISLKEKRE